MIKSFSVLLSVLILVAPIASMAQEQPEKSKPAISNPPENEETYFKGSLDGRLSASENYSAGGWFAGGIVSGVVLGLIGTAVVAGVSQIGTPDPPDHEMYRIQSKNSDYQAGFMTGFGKKARGKKLGSSVIGGCLGTLAFVIIYASSQSR